MCRVLARETPTLYSLKLRRKGLETLLGLRLLLESSLLKHSHHTRPNRRAVSLVLLVKMSHAVFIRTREV